MLRSLYSAVSGVKAHQTYLDVTGNNIANVNTVGFKRDVVHFRDMIYQNVKNPSSPDPGVPIGGVNPAQVGLGVAVGSIETAHTQGSLQSTGIPTDMAIQGAGYFVVKNGSMQLYTRAGNFALDRDGNLVMQGNGYMVQGYSYKDTYDANGNLTRTEDTQLGAVNIPVGEKIPAKATTLAAFRCNLCATDSAEIADITSIPGGVSKVARPHDYTAYGGVGVTYVSSSAPVSAVEGETYFNTGERKIYIFRNNAWVPNDPSDAAAETYYYGQNAASGVSGQFSRIYTDGLVTAPHVATITPIVVNAVGNDHTTSPVGALGETFLEVPTGLVWQSDGTTWATSAPMALNVPYVQSSAGANTIYIKETTASPAPAVPVDRVENGGIIYAYDGTAFAAVPQNGTGSGPVVTSRKIVDAWATTPPTTITNDMKAGYTVLVSSGADAGKIYQLNSTRTAWTQIDPMQNETAYAVRDDGKMYVLDSVGNPTEVANVLDESSGDKNVFSFDATTKEWKSINNTKNSPTALSPSSNSVTTQATITAFGESIMQSHDWEDKYTVYDSRGNPQTMVVVFRKVVDRPAEPNASPPIGAESEWDWYAYYTNSDGEVMPQYGQGAGTLVFGDDGLLKRTYYYEPTPATPSPNGTNTPTAPEYNWTVVEKVIGNPQDEGKATGKVVADFNTAAAQGKVDSSGTAYYSNMITMDFLGSDYAKTLGLTADPIDGVTNYGSPSTTKLKAQDGYEMGVLNDWSVGANGVITGSYSNGRNLPIARVALATFANPQGLSQVGETCFAETVNSGIAQIGAPQTNGAGSIQGNTVEMSNVDLSEEFVNLIRAQRGFQASSRVVTTSDQVLEELINLKR